MTHHELPDQDAANNVLHWAGIGGYPACSFTTALIAALGKADRTNMAKLATVYPTYAAAMAYYKDHNNGVAILKEIAEA